MAKFHLVFVALLIAFGLPARSQSTGAPPSVAPPSASGQNVADARTTTAPLIYRSPFTAYQVDKIQEPGSWREINDRVGSVGGWRVYAREAQLPTSTPPAVDKPTPAPRN